MGYLHIPNLYKDPTILLFHECWALEKVHGTSAHVMYRAGDHAPTFASGGEKHANFVNLFDQDDLRARMSALGYYEVTVYGEAYGGKQQGMHATYGPALCFIVFDVSFRSGPLDRSHWLSVPEMAQVATALGLEAVPFDKVSTALAELDRVRDTPSVVAQRRGCGANKPREGVVLRPICEMTTAAGERVIAKHKIEAFSERATPQKIVDLAKLQVLSDATAIALEWATPMRLTNVIGKLPRVNEDEPPLSVKDTAAIIKAMLADIRREAAGEIIDSKEACAAIGKKTSALFKGWLSAQQTDTATARSQPLATRVSTEQGDMDAADRSSP